MEGERQREIERERRREGEREGDGDKKREGERESRVDHCWVGFGCSVGLEDCDAHRQSAVGSLSVRLPCWCSGCTGGLN